MAIAEKILKYLSGMILVILLIRGCVAETHDFTEQNMTVQFSYRDEPHRHMIKRSTELLEYIMVVEMNVSQSIEIEQIKTVLASITLPLQVDNTTEITTLTISTDVNGGLIPSECDPNSNCTNGNGGYNCSCLDGYTETFPDLNISMQDTSTGLTLDYIIDVDVRFFDSFLVNYLRYLLTNINLPLTLSNSINVTDIDMTTVCGLNGTEYECECEEHHVWSSDTCDVHQVCDVIVGGTCGCIQGLPSEGQLCQRDINECKDTQSVCGPNSHCTNIIGSHMCSCWSGFEVLNPDSPVSSNNPCDLEYHLEHLEFCDPNLFNDPNEIFVCLCINSTNPCKDIFECFNPSSVCGPNAYCYNYSGRYLCSCWEGYDVIDGNQSSESNPCIDVDECFYIPDICGPNSICNNTAGSYDCLCMNGYNVIDPNLPVDIYNPCTDLDECDETPDICGPNSICNNTAGSYDCWCMDGFFITNPNLPINSENPCTEGKLQTTTTPPQTTKTETTTTVAATGPVPTTSSSLIVTMNLSMKINKIFDTSLTSDSEGKYKFYAESIKLAIEESYNYLPNYIQGSVKMIRFRPGSIIADYMIYATANSLDFTSAHAQVSDILSKAGIPVTPDAFARSEETNLTTKNEFYPHQNVELRCTHSNSVGGTLKWTVNEKDLVQNSAKYSITNGGNTLTVRNASESDSGRYACIIKMATMSYIQWQKIVIEPHPKIKVDKTGMKFQCEDQVVSLTCCADGYPLEWDPIPDADQVKDSESGCVTLQHKISSASCGSNEIFTCRLKDMKELETFDYYKSRIQVQTVTEFDCKSELLGVGKKGEIVTVPCEKGLEGHISYQCQGWGWSFMEKECVIKVIKDLERDVEVLHEEDISVFMSSLSNAVEQNNATITQSADTIQTIVNILVKLVSISQTIAISQPEMKNFLKIVDIIASGNAITTWQDLNNDNRTKNKSIELLQAIENISKYLSDDNFMIKTSSIQLTRTTIQNTFIGTSQLQNATTQIIIPNVEATPITIIVFTKLDNILPTRNTYNDRLKSDNYINGDVVVVKVNEPINNISFTFDLTNTSLKNPQCVYWDFDLNHWDSYGCKVKLSGNKAVTCECNHTTSFSILMSPFAPDLPALAYITYIGVAISMASLVLCLIIEMIVWKSVTGNDTSYMRHVSIVNMSVSLLIADIWFIIGAAISKPGESTPVNPCSAVVFFMHFFYLALFFWMFISALLLFYRTVMVLSQMSRTKMMVIAFTVGYCAPLLIAVITVASTAGAGRYIWTRDACWLNWFESKALLAFVIPALTIVAFNLLVLIVAVCKILKRGVGATAETDERHTLVVIARCVGILTPLFGLTWGFGIGTIVSPNFANYVVFATLNSLQGFLVLVFGTLLDSKVRESHPAKLLLRNLISSPVRNTNAGTSTGRQFVLHRINVGNMSETRRFSASSSSSSNSSSHSFMNA